MAKVKKRWGDRKDGIWLRDMDALHAFTPYMFPNRCDNEAFISENVDLTALQAYLDSKNAAHPDAPPYTMFHMVAAALVKAFVLRPKMNRFVKGCRMYQRRWLTLSFVVKKTFQDESHEALAYLTFDENTTIDTLHEAIMKEINTCRGDAVDNSTSGMDMLTKLPRPVMRFVMWILNILDYHGRVPDFLVKTDPNHASIFISNLGSIGLKAGYHHLTNWGTTSLFVVIGKKKKMPVYDDDGNVEMHEMLPLGLTLDERIADGYYYSKTVKLLNYLLSHPEELEKPAREPVDY